MSLTVSLKSSN